MKRDVISWAMEHAPELAVAHERAHDRVTVDNWVAGAKVGAFCGTLVGLAVGCAGAIGWISFARSLV
jgi:hypothetical protein